MYHGATVILNGGKLTAIALSVVNRCSELPSTYDIVIRSIGHSNRVQNTAKYTIHTKITKSPTDSLHGRAGKCVRVFVLSAFAAWVGFVGYAFRVDSNLMGI